MVAPVGTEPITLLGLVPLYVIKHKALKHNLNNSPRD